MQSVQTTNGQRQRRDKKDIYNMDETGFQMGVASTAKVICGSETRDSHVKSIQPGNCEWITAIVAISASGSILPPQIYHRTLMNYFPNPILKRANLDVE